MLNEEFQRVVLQELSGIKNDICSLKEGQKRLETGQGKLEARMENLEGRMEKLDVRMEKLEDKQEKFEKKLDAVYEQTAQLIEFRNEVNQKLDNIIEDNKSIHEILGEHEVSIRTLRRKPV